MAAPRKNSTHPPDYPKIMREDSSIIRENQLYRLSRSTVLTIDKGECKINDDEAPPTIGQHKTRDNFSSESKHFDTPQFIDVVIDGPCKDVPSLGKRKIGRSQKSEMLISKTPEVEKSGGTETSMGSPQKNQSITTRTIQEEGCKRIKKLIIFLQEKIKDAHDELKPHCTNKNETYVVASLKELEWLTKINISHINLQPGRGSTDQGSLHVNEELSKPTIFKPNITNYKYCWLKLDRSNVYLAMARYHGDWLTGAMIHNKSPSENSLLNHQHENLQNKK
ncbi:hypothetical protein ACFE04_009315 [Oxalis oulophora]